MSLSAAITVIVVMDVALLGFLAWMMSHPRHLIAHVLRHESPRLLDGQAFGDQPDIGDQREMILETAA